MFKTSTGASVRGTQNRARRFWMAILFLSTYVASTTMATTNAAQPAGAARPRGRVVYETTTAYDGNTVTVTDARGTETRTTHDGLGREVEHALGYTYWPNGLRKTATDATGVVSAYAGDGRNRLAQETAHAKWSSTWVHATA